MPSATQQAVSNAPVILPRNLTDPLAVDDWYKALPSSAQRDLDKRLIAIVRRAPPVIRLALQRDMAYSSPADPMPMSLDGMGYYHTTSVRGDRSYLAGGLGWIGPLISSVMQVGVGLYTAREQRDLAKDLQSNALQNDRAIAEATLAMQRETELAMIAAQRDAASIAGAASVGRAQQYAPVLASSMKWIGIAVATVAVVGGGAWFVSRRRKK